MGKPPQEEFSCELYSNKFFALCAAGGALACGSTHTFITPLDLVKCRMQIDPERYQSIARGFKVSLSEGGLANLVKGWAPTFIGYSLQGSVKFSGYEFFKYKYSGMVSEEAAYEYRTYLYLAASATAEVIADVFLAPFEATKVRIQTTPCYTSKMREAMPHMKATEGLGVFYRSLLPLWGRQVPYTMMKFSSFEKTVEYLYANVVPKKREECTKVEQLAVTFTAGYIAGVLCAVVSHPADVLVSKLSKDPSASVGSVLSELGITGLWGGLVARIIMVGTLTGLQWFVYDAFKVYTKMPRPPPPTPPKKK
ncbi:Phosphate carrier protein, mitochondrial [Eumeta japonica]|uniref:Phosphate carrier protein, mitochondrial n=1 Tax=Eumeta variegata TaxID=151549 RepID=A0A4C1U611_EUMVA|nr:Phosphate carrier protein, mitochondrial [Eumeta japonica]